ncbi:MAG TPA: hypothetical protein VFV72_08705 [Candidatus Limnocylindrales bacterium]|nr:hypothetical protein [Candidatus Limnocylindrales bacterium]
MIHEHEATQYASAAMDFPLADHEERWLQAELADCPVCAERASAYHEQLRLLRRLPVMSASDATRVRITQAALSGRADTRSPMLLVLAAALLVGLLLALTVAAGAFLRDDNQLTLLDPTLSPSIGPSVDSIASPPASTPIPPPVISRGEPIPVDSVVEVVASDLRVRSLPAVSAESNKLEPFLQPGDRLFVMSGPVVADDYDWYQVVPIAGTSRLAEELPSGWIASADHDGTPWVAAAEPECPDPVDIEALQMQPLAARIACFADEPLWISAIVQGVFTDGCAGGPCGPRPWTGAWIARSDSKRLGALNYTFEVAVDPASAVVAADIGTEGLTVLHGSFDRPDALGCGTDGPHPAPTFADLVACRGLFVVDDVRAGPPFGRGSIVTSVTDGLRVRSEPYVGDGSTMYTPLLGGGTTLAIVDGPVLASGYTWFQVVVPSVPRANNGLLIGWVAAADNDTGQPWIGPADRACPNPDELTVALLSELTKPPEIAGGLACYGAGTDVDGTALTIRGRMTPVCAEADQVDDRDWIGLGAMKLIIEADGATVEAVPHPRLALPFGCNSPPDETMYEVDGHFDDPGASLCVSDRPERAGSRSFDYRISEFRCRSTFVVSAVNASG